MKILLRAYEHVKFGPGRCRNGLIGDSVAGDLYDGVDPCGGSGGNVEARVMKDLLRAVLRASREQEAQLELQQHKAEARKCTEVCTTGGGFLVTVNVISIFIIITMPIIILVRPTIILVIFAIVTLVIIVQFTCPCPLSMFT
jgi:hypothetical protein